MSIARSSSLLALLALLACNGSGDKDTTTPMTDSDADGYASDVDCDDLNDAVHPDAEEICDGVDNDCDEEVDEDPVDGTTWYMDGDADGFGLESDSLVACDQPSGYVAAANEGFDCDDTDVAYHPGADESDCNDPNDYNCDGSVEYEDLDGDGWGACVDCDDTTELVNPGVNELCDGLDNDCDDEVDEEPEDGSTWYRDLDGDGYGDAEATRVACEQPTSYVDDATDCDDAVAEIHPAADEVCDSVDNDCDGTVDEDDAIDAPTWYADTDSDSYGDPDSTYVSCEQPSGYVGDGTDCDDGVTATNPGADETCNEVDDNCDGTVDNEPVDGSWYYLDDDADTFGDPSTGALMCDGVENDYDCDDTDALEPLVVDGTSGSAVGAGTASDPMDTIQGAIDAATQCVVVYSGTYTELVDFYGRNISVTGVDGAETTTIDATGLGQPAVSFTNLETSDAKLSGFTITGGEGRLEESSYSWACSSIRTCTEYYSTYCGGGILVDGADPTLSDLIIESNVLEAASTSTSGDDTYYTYSYGGGMCLLESGSSISGVAVSGNFADQGGGLYIDSASTVTIEQTWIGDNTAAEGAGIQVDGGSLSLTNVASVWNEASTDAGGVYVIDGTLTATNVTHGGDDGPTAGGIYLSGSSTGTVMNSIVYGAGTGVGVYADSTATFTGSYNNVYGNTGGEYSGTTDPTGTSGNLSSDPLFTSVTDDGDWTNDDWSLTSSSPSVDAGDTSSSYYDADGTTNDQGAFGGPNSTWDDGTP